MTAAIYVATASVVKVSLGASGGNRVARFIQRGDILPEGLDVEQLERLTARGLIAAVVVEVPEEVEPVVVDVPVVDATAVETSKPTPAKPTGK